VNSKASGAVGNSLATSDQCHNFKDASGGDYISEWQDIYLPPITKRLNGKLHGNLTLTDDQVSLFPYLCGFETQITGRVSPWCDVFTKKETLEYEYAQDLRYYYGTGEWI
jgi:acid phosphatase